MSSQIQLIALIDAMNDKPIAFNRHYVRLGCGINGALMLSQMVYWSKRTKDRDGVFYKTQEDWEEETGLTRYEQETARKTLRKLGFVSEIKRGVPCKIHFKVNHDALYQALIQYAEIHHSSMWDSNILDCEEPSNSDVENQHTNTENTQEITTDIKLSRADLEKILKGKKPVQALMLIGLNEDVAKRFNEYRKSIKKPLTLDAVIKHYHETCNAGISTNDSAKIVLSESWQGFASRYNWQHAYSLLKSDTQPIIPQNFTEVQGDW
ncbi:MULTISPECIES: DNA-binding protein [unclassified Acinetobacter]|uniref:DNA-binding protein n=1 Tax=unclassified Acinetobacter TaxID=196816 RepID=UPI002934AA21|nr:MULTISPECIES: DNA-binding protein [unclassified Acinetobacter]WOE32773.1 DNA-binding protein [Acinetobacter sp. SAAs470]WOE38250.1 DNA-binding protein [Acinetobacter sp. SAAs474]